MISSVKKHLVQFTKDYLIKTEKSQRPFKKGDKVVIEIVQATTNDTDKIEKCTIRFKDLQVAYHVPYDCFRFVDESEGGAL